MTCFAPCKNYEDEFVRVKNAGIPAHNQLLSEYDEKLRNISELAGKKISSVAKAAILFDEFMSDYMGQLPVPEWIEEVYPNGLAVFPRAQMGTFSTTPSMMREKTGPMVKEIRRSLTNNPDTLLDVYSGHDITVFNLALGLKLMDQMPNAINYTTTIVIELYEEDGNKDVEVRLFEMDKAPQKLVLDDCQPTCSLSQFLAFTESTVLENPLEYCQNPLNYTHSPEFLQALYE